MTKKGRQNFYLEKSEIYKNFIGKIRNFFAWIHDPQISNQIGAAVCEGYVFCRVVKNELIFYIIICSG